MSAKFVNKTAWPVFVLLAAAVLPASARPYAQYGASASLRQGQSADIEGQMLAQGHPFSDVLVGQRWDIRSESLGSGLAGTSLDATFMSDGSFVGMLNPPPGDRLVMRQQVHGRWQAAGPLLFLIYNYLMAGYPSPTQIPIQIAEMSQNKLVGVDKFGRLWEFRRIR